MLLCFRENNSSLKHNSNNFSPLLCFKENNSSLKHNSNNFSVLLCFKENNSSLKHNSKNFSVLLCFKENNSSLKHNSNNFCVLLYNKEFVIMVCAYGPWPVLCPPGLLKLEMLIFSSLLFNKTHWSKSGRGYPDHSHSTQV